ncbi:MAG: acetyltransferase [Deinococcus sp.]|nr:acetyltransferase [Deinococcus sp.]
MSKDLVIFGTGGFAREVHQLVEDLNRDSTRWNFLGFLDGNPERHGVEVHGFPVLGDLDWLGEHQKESLIIAVGSTVVRRKLVHQVRERYGNSFATLVHPLAWIGNRVALGEGSIVCAGTLITTDIQIGQHVILNLDCTVGHDAQIEDFVTVAPSVNISGNVRVGQGSDLGTGSAIIQNVQIGNWTIVGAGSVVVRDLPANVTAVGVPAKPIKEHPEGWYKE